MWTQLFVVRTHVSNFDASQDTSLRFPSETPGSPEHPRGIIANKGQVPLGCGWKEDVPLAATTQFPVGRGSLIVYVLI